MRSVGGIIPAECRLILLCVIGLDGFGLDDDGGIAAGEGRLSVVIVRVTLHEVSPNAMAIAVAMETIRYLMAFLSRSF